MKLGHLTLAEPADGAREHGHDLGAEPSRDLRRPRQKEISGQDRDKVAPASIGALDPPAGVGFVDHVVVVERTHVDQLDRDGALHDVFPGARSGRGRRCQ